MKGIISKTYDEVGLAIEDLHNGRIEAVVCDDSVAATRTAERKIRQSLKIAQVIESAEIEYYGIAAKKGNKRPFPDQQGIKAVQAKESTRRSRRNGSASNRRFSRLAVKASPFSCFTVFYCSFH